MAEIDRKYHNLLEYIIDTGYQYVDPNRKGVIRTEVPSYNLQYHLDGGYPLLTTKKVFVKGIIAELLWFLRGDVTLDFLHKHNVSIWDKDAMNFSKDGDYVGKAYGYQWRHWNGKKDQILDLIFNLLDNPMSTRHIVTAWNPSELEQTALPPCHWAFEIICFCCTYSIIQGYR